MKVLQIHNKYRNFGGEDAVVDNEYKLLLNHGFEVKQIFFDNTKISPLRSFYNKESYNLILEIIKEFKPAIVHVHNIFYEASPSILIAAKKAGVPVIMTLHNFRLLCPGAFFLRDGNVCTKCKDIVFPYYGVMHKCFQDSYSKSFILASFLGLNKTFKTWEKNIDKFIVLTPFIENLVLTSSLGLQKDSVIVKANSTDDLIDHKFNTKAEKKDFLFVGRLSKEKGVNSMIAAFNELPQYNLHIVGTGELEKTLKAKAKKNIIFYGKKDRDFIKSMLAKVKALIFPSIWYEGLPNTIIEAFSSGTPVLASNMDNINQIVTQGYNGDTFLVNNITSMMERIIEFCEKDTTQYQINARKTFENQYTHEINFKNLEKIYLNLLQKKNSILL